jgi:hypothetical protein
LIKKKKHHTIALVEHGMAKIPRCLIEEMLGSVFVVSLFPGLPRWGILSDMHCGCYIAISGFFFHPMPPFSVCVYIMFIYSNYKFKLEEIFYCLAVYNGTHSSP